MKGSYCGLCDDCQLGSRDFREALARVKAVVDNFRADWWSHCFPGEEGFSFPEFRRGLEWLLSRGDCPGCLGGKGLEQCAIRRCARERGIGRCYDCPDLAGCNNLKSLLKKFPDHKTRLSARALQSRSR